MLRLDDRTTFLEALRPPTDYELSFAIGTTYSLDLIAALSVPLAFTRYSVNPSESAHQSLLKLDAITRFTDRVVVFCQAGRISVPGQYAPLLTYLENMVVEVNTGQGAFHPKVWVLRYEPQSNTNAPILYRLLCQSRNLTFDRCWDTVLILEGRYESDRKRAISRNHRELADFFTMLPQWAMRPLQTHQQEFIHQVQDELRRVTFELPDNITQMIFHPIYPEKTEKLAFPDADQVRRMLVISPFLGTGFLRQFSRMQERYLISRLESLQAEPKTLPEMWNTRNRAESETVFVLDPNIEDADEHVEQIELSGLHSKLYLFELKGQKPDVVMLTGSANATNAAFNHNVEFMVEMHGESKHFGIRKLLDKQEKENTLHDLLTAYIPTEDESDTVEKTLETLLDDVRKQIVDVSLEKNWHLQIQPQDDSGETLYSMTLFASDIALPDGVTIDVYPVSLANRSRSFEAELTFDPVAPIHLTSFMVFDLCARQEGYQLSIRFVQKLPVEGMPEERSKLILRHMLRNRETVLQFLLILLADDTVALQLETLFSKQNEKRANGHAYTNGLGLPLFENMVRALHQNPQRLDEIHHLMQTLQEVDHDGNLLPEEFMHIWKPLWQARLNLGVNDGHRY